MSARTRQARADKAAKHPILPFVPRMSKLRKVLIEKINIAITAHSQREDVGDMRHYTQAIDMNQEFVERSRGKGGKAKRYIKSVALQQRTESKYTPHQGKQECARRAA